MLFCHVFNISFMCHVFDLDWWLHVKAKDQLCHLQCVCICVCSLHSCFMRAYAYWIRLSTKQEHNMPLV